MNFGEDIFLALEKMDKSVVVFDHNYKYLFVNANAVDLLGRPKEEMLSKTMFDLFPDIRDSDFYRAFQRAITTQTTQYIESHYSQWNRWYENHIMPTPSHLYIIMDDITERKLAEKRLCNESLVREALLDNLPCVALIIKKDTREIVASNKGARGIGAIPGKTCYEACSQRDDSCPWCLAPEVWKSNESRRRQIEYRGSHYEGVWIPLDDEHYVHYIFDITEQKRTEQSLEGLAAFVLNNPAPVLQVDLDGVVQKCNPAAERVFGKPIAGESVKEHLPSVVELIEDDASASNPHHASAVIHGRHFQFTLLRHEPTESFYIYGSDITERKRLEEHLRQSEKMNAIGQLAGGIAHDFNNQLAGVLGYADMLVNRLEDETLGRYATNIKKGATRAADLTAQLLAFGRKGKYLSVPVNIHKLIADVSDILEHSIDKRIKIQQHLKASPASVMGDPSQLQNIILNISLNARDAMPDGGALIFETELMELDEDFCHRYANDLAVGSYLELSVSDTGCGMAKETQSHIFEPFFTTKDQGKGTGMGLASAYGAVHNHGGAITFTSETGHGTKFCLFLPAMETVSNEDEPESSGSCTTGTARILLVDDEESVRDVATDMLAGLGYKVTVCSDGREAVGCYEKSWRQIDLVILDMVMPELGGKEAFAAMKKINPDISAILSSGYSLEGDAQSILDDGVMAFVGKPFEQAELSQKVGQVLRGE